MKFRILWIYLLVLAVLITNSLRADGLSRKRTVENPKRKPVSNEGCCAFQNVLKNIFNDKKRAVVRVVCVSKPDLKSKDENNPKQVTSGSGFFVSPKAHILTAASIVKNANTIWVDYMGASYSAECIGMDQHTNIAVLKLLQSPSEFEVIDITENNHKNLSEVGSFVVFVGCKLCMDPLPELGNVSGKNISYSENEFLTTYLRTNLMFCGGESGSPVFELDGNLAGMMVASLPEMASSFVLPKRAISKVFNEIVKNGTVKHPKIGIDVLTEYKFGIGQEIVISKVTNGSEAENGGLQVGDVLKKIGDFEIRYKEDLYNAIFFCFKENIIDIIVARDGKELSFKIKSEYSVE